MSKNNINIALKEWDVTINALSAGEMIFLLRKGGIKETRKNFQLEEKTFWLYPTFEHQKPELLKEKYSKLVTPVTKGWHPETVKIKCQATVTHSFLIEDSEVIKDLLPYHIWNEKFVGDRLQFKPQQPINLLFLRVANLAKPIIIKYQEEYGGCKSWINLLETINNYNLTPILDDIEYQNRLKIINKIINSNSQL